jgi:hypothetical protein
MKLKLIPSLAILILTPSIAFSQQFCGGYLWPSLYFQEMNLPGYMTESGYACGALTMSELHRGPSNCFSKDEDYNSACTSEWYSYCEEGSYLTFYNGKYCFKPILYGNLLESYEACVDSRAYTMATKNPLSPEEAAQECLGNKRLRDFRGSNNVGFQQFFNNER